MRIIVNGEAREVAAGSTIIDLLDQLQCSRQRVAVEVNKQLVRRAQHAEHHLQDNDQIEIVTLVGGG